MTGPHPHGGSADVLVGRGADMSPSRPFIERPVATSLLMLAIVLAGLVGFRFLPLSARACLMVYRLTMELPMTGGWSDPAYEGHPASAAVAAMASWAHARRRRSGRRSSSRPGRPRCPRQS